MAVARYRITDLGSLTSEESEGIPVLFRLTGESWNLQHAMRTEGDIPVDLTNYTITCQFEKWTSDVSVSGDRISISNLVRKSGDTVTDLTVTKDADPTSGNFTVAFPADIVATADIPALDATTLPTLACFYSFRTGSGETSIDRLIVLYRRGTARNA